MARSHWKGSWFCGLACLLSCTGSFGQGELPEPRIEWKPEQYVCYRSGDRIVVDGRLDEVVWAEAEWTTDFVDITGTAKQKPRFRTRAKMLWDDTYFYAAAEMEEPHVWAKLTERDAVVYYDNDFELFIDPDGDTHEYYELEVNAFGTEWDLLLVRPYRDGGPAVHAWDIAGLRTAVFVDGTINVSGDRDQGWSIEIAIPWVALKECARGPSPPSPGAQWRVNFSRVEWQIYVDGTDYVKQVNPATDKPLPEDNWVWSPQGLVNMHYPEMWGFVQFSEMRVGEGTEPFRLNQAEAAKWFLRRIYYRQRNRFAETGAYCADLASLGLTTPVIPGFSEKPLLHHTSSQFEAIWTGTGGMKLTIRQDGRVR